MGKFRRIDILLLFAYFTIIPLILNFIFKLCKSDIIYLGPFMTAALIIGALKYGNERCSFSKLISLTVVFAFLVGLFCLWGFVLFPKLILGHSLIKTDGFWLYLWAAQFCLVIMGAVVFSLLNWKADPKLDHRVGIYGIAIAVFLFILILSISFFMGKY